MSLSVVVLFVGVGVAMTLAGLVFARQTTLSAQALDDALMQQRAQGQSSWEMEGDAQPELPERTAPTTTARAG